jgi:hypothetical protein
VTDRDYNRLEYTTDNLNLAAFLVEGGERILRFNWDNGPGCWMVFEDNARVEEMLVAWQEGTATVKARSYAMTLSIVKKELAESNPDRFRQVRTA